LPRPSTGNGKIYELYRHPQQTRRTDVKQTRALSPSASRVVMVARVGPVGKRFPPLGRASAHKQNLHSGSPGHSPRVTSEGTFHIQTDPNGMNGQVILTQSRTKLNHKARDDTELSVELYSRATNVWIIQRFLLAR